MFGIRFIIHVWKVCSALLFVADICLSVCACKCIYLSVPEFECECEFICVYMCVSVGDCRALIRGDCFATSVTASSDYITLDRHRAVSSGVVFILCEGFGVGRGTTVFTLGKSVKKKVKCILSQNVCNMLTKDTDD